MLLRQFAEQVVTSEIKILLCHTLQNAGYSSSSIHREVLFGRTNNNKEEDTTTFGTGGGIVAIATTTTGLNEDIGLSAAKKVSSAHLQNFISSGSIILRQIIVDDDTDDGDHQNTDDEIVLASATAGIACRLLQCPACKLVPSSSSTMATTTTSATGDDLMVRVTVHIPSNNNNNSDDYNDDDTYGLLPGDCHVELITAKNMDSLVTTASKNQKVYIWKACSSNADYDETSTDDSSITYVDRLYGTRGETPTTVIQWSKGTIF